MGQYYVPANINKNEFMSSYTFSNGAKLTESSWIGNHFIANVMVRLCDETVLASSKKIASIPFAGTWANDRIVWAGDYMDENTLFPDNFKEIGGDACFLDENGEESTHSLYNLAHSSFNELKEDTKSVDSIYNLKNLVFLNHDQKQYLLIPQEPKIKDKDTDWIINPISLMLASGNGQGGGDYFGNNEEMVGNWAGESVSISRKIPKGYTQISPDFVE